MHQEEVTWAQRDGEHLDGRAAVPTVDDQRAVARDQLQHWPDVDDFPLLPEKSSEHVGVADLPDHVFACGVTADGGEIHVAK